MTHRVTILIAAYNAGDFLPEMLDSLAAQTCKEFNLVIVDDCSTDNTRQILAEEKRFNLQVFRNLENIGLTRSLNEGLSHCQAEWIMRMDADDLCEPERVASQLAFAAAHPELVLFSSAMVTIDQDGTETGVYPLPATDAEIRFDFLFYNPFSHPSACFRSDALKAVGGLYDPLYRTCQDYELWSRLLGQGEVANQTARLVRYRRHDATVNATRSGEQKVTIDRIRAEYFKRECKRLDLASDEEIARMSDCLLGCNLREAEATKVIGLTHETLVALANSYGVNANSGQFKQRWIEICRRQSNFSKFQRIRWMLQKNRGSGGEVFRTLCREACFAVKNKISFT
jgi:glycosyltransferase involved in cell wall biosynthesis